MGLVSSKAVKDSSTRFLNNTYRQYATGKQNAFTREAREKIGRELDRRQREKKTKNRESGRGIYSGFGLKLRL